MSNAAAASHSGVSYLYDFLCAVQLGHILYFVILLFLSTCIIAYLVNTTMTMVSPVVFGAKHRRITKVVGRRLYWLAFLLELLLWCIEGVEILQMIHTLNVVFVVIIGSLAFIGYLLAIGTMIFVRSGQRSYIAVALRKLATSQVLLGLWLLVFNWMMF